uniref:Uncharacterized protein n=1 Tax=Cacopsylla melanoneura TaxID=428564 RepID=A0A8D8TXQ0_9HEMI
MKICNICRLVITQLKTSYCRSNSRHIIFLPHSLTSSTSLSPLLSFPFLSSSPYFPPTSFPLFSLSPLFSKIQTQVYQYCSGCSLSHWGGTFNFSSTITVLFLSCFQKFGPFFIYLYQCRYYFCRN